MGILNYIRQALRRAEQQSCATCRYWNRDRHINGDMHECRRRAPITTGRANWAFPITTPQEWCGDYERENTSSHDTKMHGTQKP